MCTTSIMRAQVKGRGKFIGRDSSREISFGGKKWLVSKHERSEDLGESTQE